ncbi:MAG TPA: hypothetical protein PKU67_07400 [Candidatus Hydrothermia bacterium]|nr:hypothetical protein [Candidatus Hydrothermia bacterium]
MTEVEGELKKRVAEFVEGEKVQVLSRSSNSEINYTLTGSVPSFIISPYKIEGVNWDQHFPSPVVDGYTAYWQFHTVPTSLLRPLIEKLSGAVPEITELLNYETLYVDVPRCYPVGFYYYTKTKFHPIYLFKVRKKGENSLDLQLKTVNQYWLLTLYSYEEYEKEIDIPDPQEAISKISIIPSKRGTETYPVIMTYSKKEQKPILKEWKENESFFGFWYGDEPKEILLPTGAIRINGWYRAVVKLNADHEIVIKSQKHSEKKIVVPSGEYLVGYRTKWNIEFE